MIPAELRHKYDWKSGDRVRVVDYGGVVSLVPVMRDPDRDGLGALATPGRSLVKRLVRVRRDERRRVRRR